MGIRTKWLATALLAVMTALAVATPALAATRFSVMPKGHTTPSSVVFLKKITNADRVAAAKRLAAKIGSPLGLLANGVMVSPLAVMNPLGAPDYWTTPNWANSQLPTIDASGAVVPGTGIRKFVDSLPGLGYANRNNLGQFIPVAVPDTTTYPGSDYYVIELVQYKEKLASDIPTTTLRGYRQANSTDPNVSRPSYLGPMIIAQANRPVRVKFTNKLPTGQGGNLFLPVDTTAMGAGMGPNGRTMYTQNRATLHLHGGATPWISDGTPNQWITPAGEVTSYPVGVSVTNVPDMPDPGPGSMTFFYTNQQSARLMWYHDHAYGITRLNVYAGEVAGYVVRDSVEQKLISGGTIGTTTVAAGTIPADEIPLIIQDKTFVPDIPQLAKTDPTWDVANWGGAGNLWFPHVYMPNQNPYDDSGANAMGRWDYGPWFWPPVTTLTHGVLPNGDPGTPNPSMVPEAFMDTAMVNGTAYPYVKVGRKAYRLRILNGSNDRSLNLQLYYASSNTPDAVDGSGNPTLQTASGEVTMVPAVPHPSTQTTWPATWPTDGRDGGVPDPMSVGPSFIQIGTEGGFLPAPVVVAPQPVGYEYGRRSITVLNVQDHSLFLGPAERADVIVDFSGVPDGSKLILYNDAPAPVPAFDSRLDYYTGDPDQTAEGGAPSTMAGYGPNTRTVMQFQVSGPAAASYDTTALAKALPVAYKASQPDPIVPEKAYGAATNTYSRISSTSLAFKPASNVPTVTVQMQPKAIQELFELNYGRMNATLGVELPFTNFNTQTTIPLGYLDPRTEIMRNSSITTATQVGTAADGAQIWKITHNGVDTHWIHFHLFNVQLINRVGWDGAIKPPDDNELGWKETVRMNPLEDAIVAFRPVAPTLPFKITDSIRPLDPTMALGALITVTDPTTGNALTIPNVMTNFGWEYVWHCHLLGHEENDMMRPIEFQVSPAAPTNLAATPAPAGVNTPKIVLTWTNNAVAPLAAGNMLIQRSTNASFTANVVTFSVSGAATTYSDTSVALVTKYYYRLRAENTISYSVWSNTASATSAGQLPMSVTNLHLNSATNNSLNIGWSIPTGGAPYTSIQVQYATSSNGPWTTRTTTANATSYNITGLVHLRKYWIRVVSVNAYGSTLSSTITASVL